MITVPSAPDYRAFGARVAGVLDLHLSSGTRDEPKELIRFLVAPATDCGVSFGADWADA